MMIVETHFAFPLGSHEPAHLKQAVSGAKQITLPKNNSFQVSLGKKFSSGHFNNSFSYSKPQHRVQMSMCYLLALPFTF